MGLRGDGRGDDAEAQRRNGFECDGGLERRYARPERRLRERGGKGVGRLAADATHAVASACGKSSGCVRPRLRNCVVDVFACVCIRLYRHACACVHVVLLSPRALLTVLSLSSFSRFPFPDRFSLLGVLFDPPSGRVAGLRPVHYVSMATPHLGCTASRGPAQVPLVKWLNAIGLGFATSRISEPFSARMFGESGRQFFFRDGARGKGGNDGRNVEGGGAWSPPSAPIIFRLAYDEPDAPFFSALASFETHTAYANRGGDHLVGWANASVRSMDGLPTTIEGKGKGVVLEDPIENAWGRGEPVGDDGSLHAAKGSRSGSHLSTLSNEGSTRTSEAGESSTDGEVTKGLAKRREGPSATLQLNPTPTAVPSSPAELPPLVLSQLQKIPWRRVDVCFADASLSLLSHQHIQTQREWLNKPGRQVAQHLAQQLFEMEQLRGGISEDIQPPSIEE